MLVVATHFCTVGLTVGDKIDGSIYRDITLGLVAAYALANTWQKVKGGSNE